MREVLHIMEFIHDIMYGILHIIKEEPHMKRRALHVTFSSPYKTVPEFHIDECSGSPCVHGSCMDLFATHRQTMGSR